MENRTINMTTGSPAKHILSFAVPLILTNVGQQFYMIADAAIVGRGVGVRALRFGRWPQGLRSLPQESLCPGLRLTGSEPMHCLLPSLPPGWGRCCVYFFRIFTIGKNIWNVVCDGHYRSRTTKQQQTVAVQRPVCGYIIIRGGGYLYGNQSCNI